MQNSPNTIVVTNPNRTAYYTALITLILTIISFGIAILTPPLSGPLCTEGCYEYPFTDIAARFPRDYIWMYPAIVLTLVYVMLMACIHQYAREDKKTFSLMALCMALMSGIVLVMDYFLQVSVIQPSILLGETDGIAILTQFNSHGIFIALEEIGYLLMSASFVLAAPVFSVPGKAHKGIRWTFIIAFALSVAALIGYSAVYGVFREYRFEIAVISINWLALIIASILLCRAFSRNRVG